MKLTVNILVSRNYYSVLFCCTCHHIGCIYDDTCIQRNQQRHIAKHRMYANCCAADVRRIKYILRYERYNDP